jgi:DNA repair protein RadA/Sms
MARNQTVYVCSSCGGEAPKWQGQCPHCQEWNSMGRLTGVRPELARAAANEAIAVALEAGPVNEQRLSLGIDELDRVFGGGLSLGSVSLLGGEPGIGKSTLLLQVAATLAAMRSVVYASGEESTEQIAHRARRLGLRGEQLALLSDNSLESILALSAERRAELLVIDSIQTMQTSEAESSPGSPRNPRRRARCAICSVDSSPEA